MTWPQASFEDIFYFIRNGLSVKQSADAGGLPVTRIETISDGTINLQRMGYAGVTREEGEKWLLQSGDILLSHINSVEHIGKCAIYNGDEGPVVHGMNLLCLRPNQEILFPKYAVWALKNPNFKASILKYVNKAVNQASISIGNLKTIEIPIPPLDEQKRIAAILDQADELRRLRARALEKLSTLGQAIFHEMFGAGVGNTQRAIEELGSIQGGLQVAGSRETFPRKEKYLRVANVHRDRLELEEIKSIGLTDSEFERTKLQDGDILIVEGHGNPNEIGRTAVWQGVIEDCVHQNHLIRLRPDTNIVLPQYVSSYLNSKVGRQVLISTSRTTSGLNTISTAKVKAAKIPVPSLQDQRNFVQRCERINAEIIKAIRSNETQEALFASLQSAAFQGKL